MSARAADAVGGGAVTYLRRRTVGRAAESYRRWIGRAVGWWTILYLIFWLVVFAIAGVESLTPLATYLPSPAGALAVAGALVLVFTLAGGRAPPLTLDRRDLYRLALGPQQPWAVLRWRYRVKQAGAAVAGLIIGAVWSLLAPALFGFGAWYAAPTLALLALALLDVRWLRYVSHAHHGDHDARGPANRASWLVGGVLLVALAAVALARFVFGIVLPTGGIVDAAGAAGLGSAGSGAYALAVMQPLAGLTVNSPWVLGVPLAALVFTQLAVRNSLRFEWPPRFGPQSLVLGQMQALRASQVMAVMAGMSGGFKGGMLSGVSDDGERRRLLDALHDRPGATKPKRSLPLPAPQTGQWLAIAWRTASALYRRPLLRLGFSLMVALLAVVAVLAASGGMPAAAAAEAPEGGSVTTSGVLGGALGVLLAALFLARAASGLLGPYFDIGVRPVDPLTRSYGRSLPALALLTLFLLPAALLLSVVGSVISGALPNVDTLLPALIGAASLIGLVVLALEKYSSWSGAAPTRIEPQLVAAMLAALPALLLGAFGMGDWTLITQFLLLGLVAIIPV